MNSIGRRPMPGCNHKRRDILRKRGCAAEHRMRANAHMLMHSGHAAQNGPVVHLHMTRNLCIVGQDCMAANEAIMRNMHICRPITAYGPMTTVESSCALQSMIALAWMCVILCPVPPGERCTSVRPERQLCLPLQRWR